MNTTLPLREITTLLGKITTICDKHRVIAEESGDNYNLFRVIGLTSNEVRVHSAFLANLLEPKASHGQKTKFLELFIQEFDIADFDFDSAEVTVEKGIGSKSDIDGGRIDIRIVDKNGYHIIIENKIYARDHDNQLIRYSRYGKDKPWHKLFYLTLNGDMPDEEMSCIDEHHSISLKENEDFYLLSYSNDIIRWLELCREKSVTKPLLRESISHYINLIKHLTNQSTNQNMNQEIIKEFLKPENVNNLANIKECIQSAQIELQTRFWSYLEDKLESEGFVISRSNYNEYINAYYTKSKNNMFYGIETKFASKDNVFFVYRIEIDHSIYGGFIIREKGQDSPVCDKPDYEKYVEIVKSIDTKYKNKEYVEIVKNIDSNWWLGWKYSTPQLNFKNIDEETCSNLAKLEETVDYMVNYIKEEINIFKEKEKLA